MQNPTPQKINKQNKKQTCMHNSSVGIAKKISVGIAKKIGLKFNKIGKTGNTHE